MPRPLGLLVKNWTPVQQPVGLDLRGAWAHLQQIDTRRDAPMLWDAFREAPQVWDYLFSEPPEDFDTFAEIIAENAARDLQPCYVISATNALQPTGYACFWTNNLEMGSTEIGNVNLSPALQQTPVATDAFYLMIAWAFANGYRRVEWKCNALNAPSRRAAQRLGFSYEGIFRNHMITKGRNRDTAWFAITDQDWADLKGAYERWLDPANFDPDGQQRTSLADLTRPHLFQADPFT